MCLYATKCPVQYKLHSDFVLYESTKECWDLHTCFPIAIEITMLMINLVFYSALV